MPPARAKKTRASTSSHEANTAPPVSIPIHEDDDAHTPEQQEITRQAAITQAQKQALIDNLQLEITERARKLRAQYAMQAQALRARLEMRVNRIPQVLRKRNMQDLLDEHAEKQKPAPAPPVPAKDTVPQAKPAVVAKSPERKSLKRESEHFLEDDDKENAPASSQDLPNPKKRAKTTTANTKATRTISRKVMPSTSTVLSPKSHNSRTLPRSPLKPAFSLEKAALSRPLSPVKSIIQHLAPSRPAPRAPSRQAKRPGTATDTEPRSSEASNSSAGTTIVHKPAAKGRPATKKAAAPAKTTAGRKPAAAAAAPRKENVAPVAVGGGRTLRKRG